MTLPVLEIPEDLSSLCKPYRPIFSKPQFTHFQQFITSLLITDEANIEALAEGFRLCQSYDSLHHFVSEGTWDINDVLEQTVAVIRKLPEGQRFHEKGMLVIDDTLIEKYGKLMEAVGKLWDHSHGKWIQYAHCLVGLCWTDHKKLRYPLRFEVYRKEEDCRDDTIEFKTKIQLAQELIDWAVKQNIPFQTVVFDSWFFCKELADHIESLGRDWISTAKTNRKIVYRGRTITCQDYAALLTPLALPATNVKGNIYAISSQQMRFTSLKRQKGRIRLVVSYQQQSKEEGGGYFDPVFLVSNRLDTRPERLIRAYQIRWNIETFFKDAKQALGLGQYQMRGLSGIKSHWCLVFTSAVLLELVRYDVCTKEGKSYTEMSFGDLKKRAFGQALRSIIKHTLDWARAGLTDDQVYAKLGM